MKYIPFLLLSFSVAAESTHVHELDNILISAPNQSVSNTALPVSILTGEELRTKIGGNIGETLAREPGVFNQSFGPGVGQPVIRGQSGSRVKVLQNSLGSLDVASISPDHANTAEPLLADRVEVLRGPASLLYGSGAIGGVVNIIDNRIPDKLFDRPVQGAVEQRYNTVNEGKSTVFKLEGSQDMFAWHVDGFYRDSIDQQIPTTSFADGGGSTGRLLNSDTRAYSGSAGASVIGEAGFLGIAINHLENNYGIPIGEEGEPVTIDVLQTRYDFKAGLNQPFTGLEKINFKLAYNDYKHTELEDGVAGTTFTNEGYESRVEAIQTPWWIFDHGVVGFQSNHSVFAALGEEAIVPRSDIDSLAFFTIQDIHTEHLVYEFGLRVEQQWIDAETGQQLSHTPVSFSLSALWEINPHDSLKLTFSRSQRAPEIQELLSNGPHHATETFDVGNDQLTEETSYNVELGFHFDRSWLSADINLFYNRVDDYIAQINSGLVFDEATETILAVCPGECMDVFNTRQMTAEFKGFEAQIQIPLMQTAWGALHSEWFADYVHGEFDTGEAIPRLPPLRYGSELSWQGGHWQTAFRVTRAEAQERPGINENATAGYWKLDASASYNLALGEQQKALLFAKAQNLLDEEIRQSVSFLREVSPEAGFGVEFGVRLQF